ncbi:hypothetical protein PVAND_017029 [Polypedilum vanderplanki]|uniref:Uncharacterized protein n=1 Tax=Polypedilum vanderplanki TaxID=319348 RepID=A0A9J6BH40_POLVA|nr:hypothetical protein PVAND_017029 [Polypedilum vanderplanki]
MKFLATLALLCALAFLTVEAQKYTKKSSCSCEQKVCEKGFYFSKHDCACRCGLRSRDCFYPQQLNKTACECQCPPELNESKCINWQEWDDDWCECYCPYSRHHKCPSKKVWNYKNCHCDCINKEPKGGCRNGKWNKNECQCISNPTTTTTKASTTTTSMPLCSYGTKLYNNDNSIDGIIAGTAVDGTTAYVGFTQVNGVTIPGTLMLNNTVLPGLMYVHNNNATVNQTSNVFYLTNTADCNCQFVDKNASLPVGSFKVTLNNGTNRVHIGINDDTVKLKFNISGTMVGSIISGNLHYFNGYDKFDAVTKNYKILVCRLSLNFTTTLSPIITVNIGNDTTIASALIYAQQIDDIFNQFTSVALSAEEILTNLNNLTSNTILLIKKILADVNTNKVDAEVNKEILDIFTNSSTFQNSTIGQRKKRQTIDNCQNATQLVEKMKNTLSNLQADYNERQNIINQVYEIIINSDGFTLTLEAQKLSEAYLAEFKNLTTQINQCKINLNKLIAIRDDVCSRTTTTTTTTSTTTTTTTICPYSWNSYAGNNLPPIDGLYVGKNPYGNDIYVGAGTGGGDLAPGSLEPLYLNGVTTHSYSFVYNITTNVTYLAIPSSCKCNWLTNVNVHTTPALVRLRNYYWIGRYTFADGSQVVGKIYEQSPDYGRTYIVYMSHADNNQEIQTTTFDVLQCTA